MASPGDIMLKFSKISIFVVVLAFSFILEVSTVTAQENGTVRGKVSYENRMPVVCVELPCKMPDPYPITGATVSAKLLDDVDILESKSTKQLYQTRTDKDGSYRLRLPPGRYIISVESQSRNVSVKKRTNRKVDFTFVVY